MHREGGWEGGEPACLNVKSDACERKRTSIFGNCGSIRYENDYGMEGTWSRNVFYFNVFIVVSLMTLSGARSMPSTSSFVLSRELTPSPLLISDGNLPVLRMSPITSPLSTSDAILPALRMFPSAADAAEPSHLEQSRSLEGRPGILDRSQRLQRPSYELQ